MHDKTAVISALLNSPLNEILCKLYKICISHIHKKLLFRIEGIFVSVYTSYRSLYGIVENVCHFVFLQTIALSSMRNQSSRRDNLERYLVNNAWFISRRKR